MLNVTDCEPLFQLPLPGCAAESVQLPADTMVTVAPDTVHTPVVVELYVMEPRPVASVEAEAVKFESPNVLSACVKVITWLRLAMTKDAVALPAK